MASFDSMNQDRLLDLQIDTIIVHKELLPFGIDLEKLSTKEEPIG